MDGQIGPPPVFSISVNLYPDDDKFHCYGSATENFKKTESINDVVKFVCDELAEFLMKTKFNNPQRAHTE